MKSKSSETVDREDLCLMAIPFRVFWTCYFETSKRTHPAVREGKGRQDSSADSPGFLRGPLKLHGQYNPFCSPRQLNTSALSSALATCVLGTAEPLELVA